MQHINYDVERVNLYDSVADHLEEMIVNNASKVGQKLPSEQTLAANFNVSRNVIRESLKILQARQLVSLHVGEGAYIKKPGDQSMTDVLNRIVLMDNIDPIKIYELRTILEVNACQLAAKNLQSNPGINELEKINANMRHSMGDIDRRVELDIEFHSTVARLSGNPLLELFERSIFNLVYPVMQTALLPTDGNESGILDHQAIIDVLREGDEEKAAILMNNHIQKSAQNYLDGYLIKKR